MKWFEKIYTARRDLALTQRQVAKRAKTNHVQISRIEQGEQMPKADMLYRLCQCLNVSMDYVFKDFDKFDFKEDGKSE